MVITLIFQMGKLRFQDEKQPAPKHTVRRQSSRDLKPNRLLQAHRAPTGTVLQTGRALNLSEWLGT